jgi:hypothetical protein
VSGLATLHVAGVQGVIFRLDTNTWTDERIEGVTSTIEDIHGLSDEELYAVGDNVLLRYDGTVWTSEAVPEDELGTPVANQGFRAKGVWAADSAHVWAVGDKGKIAFRDEAGVWSYQDSQWYGGTPFQAVWGFGPDHVYTLGTVGKVRRWNGSEWTVVEVKTPKKTSLGDKWPAEQVVPPEGPGLNYVGAFGLDSENLWFFDGGGLLLQYNDDYQL